MFKDKGFTLIEALVALVLISTIFSVTWSWLDAGIRTSKRIEATLPLPSLFKQFTDALRLVNFKQQRSGTIEIDDTRFVWKATPNQQSTQLPFRRQIHWDVTLFDIEVRIMRDNKEVMLLNTQQVAQWRNETPVIEF